MNERRGRIWLSPSIGSWSLDCQSHYYIRGNQVIWLGKDEYVPFWIRFNRKLYDLMERIKLWL